MKIFVLKNLPRGSFAGEVDRRLGLPGLSCIRCGPWAMTGEAYPAVRLPERIDGWDFAQRAPVDAETFARLRAVLIPHVPVGAPLWPGATFGSLMGRARKRLDPVTNAEPWDVLVDADTESRLREHLPHAPFVASDVVAPGSRMFELDAPTLARHGESSLPAAEFPPCPLCGRRGARAPAVHTLERASVPAEVDAFRSLDLPTAIFVTERFAAAATQCGFDEAWFVGVELEGPGSASKDDG